MKHNNIEKLIQKHLDRETNAHEKELLHSHLANCTECREYYEGMVSLQISLQGLLDLQPAHGFNARVLAHLGAKKVLFLLKAAIASVTLSVTASIALLFSPFTTGLLPRILHAIPDALRLYNKLQFIMSTLGQTLEPFFKNFINPFYPVAGVVLSIIIMYLISRALKQKEVPCKA